MTNRILLLLTIIAVVTGFVQGVRSEDEFDSEFDNIELVEDTVIVPTDTIWSKDPEQAEWQRVRYWWRRFLAYPSTQNVRRVYENFPSNPRPYGIAETLAETARKSFYANLGLLEKQVRAHDSNAVLLAFRMFRVSDGHFSELLNIMLGDLIRPNPKLFLYCYKRERESIPAYDSKPDIGGLLGNFGFDYVDRILAHEYERVSRIRALESVTDTSLVRVRDECLDGLRY